MTVKIIILSLAFALFFNTGVLLNAENILEPVEEIRFSADAKVPQTVLDFCVTDDGLVILPDTLEGVLRIYEKNGKKFELIKTIGKKDFSPDGLQKPAFIFFSHQDSQLVVMDYLLNKIVFYDRLGKSIFIRKPENEIDCRGAVDLKLSDSKLFISGTTLNNRRPFDLYYYDFGTRTNNDQQLEKVLLMPSTYKYGFDHSKDYFEQLRSKQSYALGGIGYVDIIGKYAYYAWEGDLNLIKINLDTGDISDKFMKARKIDNYSKPEMTDRLKLSFKKRHYKDIEKEKKGMSFVREVFANSDNVFIIYQNYSDGYSPILIQVYGHDGRFKREQLLKGISMQPSRFFYFDKSDKFEKQESFNNLYSIVGKEDSNNGYFKAIGILKYRIIK